MLIEVAFVPALVREPQRRLCVVVDVLRASTTLLAMLQGSVRRVRVAGSAAEALATAAARRTDYWVCGEVGGLPPPGFDFGNSPVELEQAALGEREVVFSTSNGTRALRAVAGAPVVLVGTLRNARAAAGRARAEAAARGLDVWIVCAGEGHGSAAVVEDTFCAGYLVEALAAPGGVTLADSATIARRLYRSYLPPGADPLDPPDAAAAAAFAEALHARDLDRLGLEDDLAHCARFNVSAIVPRLERVGDALVVVADR